MEKWIISANSNYFDHSRAFHEKGYIDWKQTVNYKVGDIVYLYMTKPISKIQFKTEVTAIDMGENDITDFSDYWKIEIPNRETHQKVRYARLKLLKEFENDIFSFEMVKKYGLAYPPQGACRVKDKLKGLLESIEEK